MSFKDYLEEKRKKPSKSSNTNKTTTPTTTTNTNTSNGFKQYLKSKAPDLYRKQVTDIDESTVQERTASFTERLKKFAPTSSNIFDDKWHAYEEFSSYDTESSSLLSESKKLYEYFLDIGEADLASYVQENINSLTEYRKALSSTRENYSRFKSKEEYEEALAAQKEQEDMLNADLNVLQTEIDDLQKLLDEAKSKKPNFSTQGAAPRNAEDAKRYSQDITKAYTEFNEYLKGIGYSSIEDIEKALAEKNAYKGRSKRLQEQVALSSVADVNSEKYDPEFEKYAQEGAEVRKTFPTVDSDGVKKGNLYEFPKEAQTALETFYKEIWEEDELKVFDYYLAKDMEDGTNNSWKYLESIKETINYRLGKRRAYSMKGDTFKEIMYAIPAGLTQFVDNVGNFFNTSDDYIPPSSTQFASGMIREDLADDGFKIGGTSIAQIGYDALHTTANMAPSIGLGFVPVVGTGLSIASVGISSAGGAYQEALNAGYSKSDARLYSTLNGAAEAGLNYLLNGAGKVTGKFTNKTISGLTSKIKRASLRTVTNLGVRGAGEFIEENLQAGLVEPVLSNAILGTDKDVDLLSEEALYNGFLGALTSVVLGTAGVAGRSTVNTISTYSDGKRIIKEGKVGDLVDFGKSLSADTLAHKLAGKVNENTGAYKIGRLLHEAGAGSLSATNMADIQKSLVRKGLTEKDAKNITLWLNKAVEGETFTDAQIGMLENNEAVSETFRDVIFNQKSTVNQRIQEYDSLLGLAYEMENVQAPTNEQTEVAEKSGLTSTNTDIETNFNVSADGKTTNTSTGETITINKNNPIAKTETVDGERVVYLNTDKGVVSSKDVSYASESEALVYESFVDLNPAFANAVIKNYDGKTPIQTYVKGMREGIVLYGMHNFQGVGKDISANTYFAELSDTDQAFALKLGSAYAESVAKKEGKTLRKAIKNATEKAESNKDTSNKTTAKKGRVSFEKGVKAKGKLQKRAVALAKHLSSAIGIDIVFYDSRTTTDPNGKGSNGYYDTETKTIHLDLQNSVDDAKTIAYTLSHELVHFVQDMSAEKYNTFAKFLMENYAKHGVNTSELLANKMAELGTTDADFAYEEMIADACETMLLDSNAVYKLMELRKTDLDLFEKIKLHLHELLTKIRNMYKELGLQPTSDEAKALLSMKDSLEQIYSLFEEAVVDAAQTYQAVQNANETIFGEATIEEGKVESGVKNQLKNHKKIGEDATAYNNRHKNVHNAILKVGIESMYEMAETMLPYLEQEGILPPDIPGKTIFKNGSYGRTGENTTLCVRTLTYEDFKDRVADEIGRPLTVSESLLVSQKIYDIATDPQCTYCYVAADRKAYDESLGEYWKAMDKYIKAMRKGGDSKALYTEYLAGRKDTSHQKRRWSQWESIAKNGNDYISAKDLTTKRKRDALIAKKNAFSEQIKDAQRYAQNASWAKTVVDYRAYKGDILRMTSKFVDMLNSEYGLRMYSFSDYTPAFIVENMQMLIDASVKGLKSLAYTKDTDYAEIFASTGQAINVSCFAKWDAESGTFVEDNRQGANWAKTQSLRKQYRNVGAVMVATNDAMVEWALKQDWVDVVIPYHIVKTGTTIANEYQWNNYTSESADKIGNKNATIYPTEHNNDFATYSNLLNERGITPRFSRWYDMVESGKLTEDQYMKLVNEVRLPASELSAVVPSFNLEAAKNSFGIDNEGNVIEGGFVDKGGYMGGWYRQGVDVNQEVMAVSEDIKAGKSSLDVDYGMSKAAKEKAEARYKKQAKKPIEVPGTNKTLSQTFVDNTLNSFNIENLGNYEQVQEQVFDTLMSEGFFTDTNLRNRLDTNEETGMVIETNKSGIDETFCRENYGVLGRFKKIVKLATIRELPNAIKHGQLIEDDVRNEHGENRGTKYAYLKYDTQVDGIDVTLKITVRKSLQKNKFWVHSFEAIKNVSGTPADTNEGVKTGLLLTDNGKIVPQNGKTVKKQVKKDSLGNELSAEQIDFFKDSKVRDADGNLLVMYHGTPNGDFNTFKISDGAHNSLMAQYGAGYYFDTNRDSAKRYTQDVNKTVAKRNPKVFEVYLNIKNPLIIYDEYLNGKEPVITKQQFADVIKKGNYEWFFTNGMPFELKNWLGKTKSEIQQMSRDEIINHWVDMTFERAYFDSDILSAMVKAYKGDSILTAMKEVFGKDGVKVIDKYGEMWVAWDTNQIKSKDNLNPTTNPDIRYQKKQPTNRELLSNALESAIDTSTQAGKYELKLLKEYQAKIDSIEKEEAHLAEVNAEIKEISFGKDTDRSKLKDLKFEKTMTQNRIHTYDKQLMRLEAMKPMKDILTREKEMVRKRTEEKGKQALAEYRKEAIKVRNHMIGEARKETRQKISESRHKTEAKAKIQKVVSELNQLLLNGTKDKHVTEGLQKAVAMALDAFNMDTVGADKRVAKYNALIAKATDPDVIASLTETRDRIQKQGDRMSDKLTKLKDAYNDIIKSSDPNTANVYDKVIANYIESAVEKVGNTSLRDMSIDQLDTVYSVYKMVLTTVRNFNKAFKMAKAESISSLGNKVMMEVEKVGGSKTHVLGGKLGSALSMVKKFDFNNLKPVYAFERIGSNTLSKLFENVRKGEDVWAVDITEAKDFKEETAKKYDYKKWDFDKVYSFKTSTGTDFSLSLDQIMSLYAYSKREQALPHLAEGGFVFDDSIEVHKETVEEVKKNGKKEEKVKRSFFKYKVNTATAHKISPFEVADIVGKLTAEQKAFVDEMQKYLSDVMGAKGNEVALEMYGVKLFKEKHYFPLKSANQYMFEQNEVAGEVKIKNSSFSKETVKHANNPVILSNFMDVWANHVNDMSMYHAFVLPLEDFNRVFNYNTPSSQSLDKESVKGFIQNAYGRHANEYISQLIKDLNGGARVDPRESVSKNMIGKFKKASVFGSASVVIQQPSAIGRALAVIGAKYFDFNPKLIKHNKLWTEVKKYAPVAIIKEMGHFDTDMGSSTVDYIKGESRLMEKVDNVISKPASYMDELTWVHIWTAVKREVKANNKDLSGEAYLQKCGERFTEVITKTQVYDSVLSRSANMRSKSVFMNMLTSFLGEPTTAINMLEDAMTKISRGQKGKGARQITSVAASVILNSMLVSFVYAARDDDEDETYWEKYIGSLTSEIIDGSNPITYYPILKDIWSIAQGFDVERSDMTLISKAIDSLKNVTTVMLTDTEDMTEEELAEHNQKIVNAWLGVAGEFSSLFGIPAKNLIRDIKAGFNVYNTTNNGAEGSWSLLWDEVAESAINTVPIVGWFANESKTDKLYDAKISGDLSVINRLKSGYKDDKAYNTAVRKALRENDPRIKEAAEARLNGDMTRYKELAYEIKGEGHFVQDDIVAAIMTEYNSLKSANKDESSSSKSPDMYNYTDYYNAVINGDANDIAVVKDYLIESGKTEKNIESNLNSYVKDSYEKGEISDSEAKSLMVSYGGKDEDESDISIRYVDFKADYPEYKDTITESRFANYYEPMEDYYGRSIADTGLSFSSYSDYCVRSAECTGIDANGDGKTDSGTKKAEVMKVINSLPITIAQKDALYFLNGWSKKTLFKEAPWR